MQTNLLAGVPPLIAVTWAEQVGDPTQCFCPDCRCETAVTIRVAYGIKGTMIGDVLEVSECSICRWSVTVRAELVDNRRE